MYCGGMHGKFPAQLGLGYETSAGAQFCGWIGLHGKPKDVATTRLSCDCRSPLIISVLFKMSSEEHVHNLDLASQPKKLSIVKLSDASSSCEILICEVHLRQPLWNDLHNDS